MSISVYIHALYWICIVYELFVLSNQTAAEQEKKQSEMETEKMWGTQVKYGTTMVQVRQ